MLKFTYYFRLCITLLILLLIANVTYAEDFNVTISYLVGTVEFRNPNEDWQIATLNMPLSSGMSIRTRMDSQVELSLPDGSTIKLEENTVFDIKDLQKDIHEEGDLVSSFKIWFGKVYSQVERLTNKRSSFEIETPTANAAVRGTSFEMDVTMNETRVFVENGEVWVTDINKQNGITLKDNQMVTITKDKAPSELFRRGQGGFLRLNSPSENSIYNSTSILFSGETVPHSIIEVSETGGRLSATATADAEGKFSFIVEASEDGNYTIKLITKNPNSDEKLGEIERHINVNTSSREFLEIEKPHAGDIFSSTSFEVRGHTSPYTNITINEQNSRFSTQSFQSGGDGNFSKIIDIPNHFNSDNTSPSINIMQNINLNPNGCTNEDLYTFEGNISDGSNPFYTEQYTIEIIAIDENGNEIGREIRNITISIERELQIYLSLNNEQIRQETYMGGGTQMFHIERQLSDGINAFSIEASDFAGNSGIAVEEVFLDRQAPIITLTNPADAQIILNLPTPFELPPPPPEEDIREYYLSYYIHTNYQVNLIITGNIHDPGKSCGINSIEVNGMRADISEDQSSFELPIDLDLNQTNILIEVLATDEAGNETLLSEDKTIIINFQ